MTTAVTSGPPTAVAAPAGPAPLGVVVVNYGPPDLLRRTLAAAPLGGDDVHVVVVDNFSSAANRAAVEQLGAEQGWHVVGLPGNRGFGVACNAGAVAARELGCRTFLFLNPDAVIGAAAVAELRADLDRSPLTAVSPRLVTSAGRVVYRGALVDPRTGGTRSHPEGSTAMGTGPGDWLTGACLAISDALFTRAGGFAEDYFLYWEDVDLSARVLAAGGRLAVRHDLVAVHDEGGTQGERRGRALSALYYRYNCRNRLLFGARTLGRRQLLGWVLRTPSASWQVVLRGGRRQLLHSPRPLLAALAGSLSGLALALPALVTGPRAGRGAGGRPALVVHPGAELYGSDRVLLSAVEGLLERGPVRVALPGPGPLVAELTARGAEVHVVAMPVLRKAVLRPAGAVRLLADAARGLPAALRLLRGSSTVYVSTTVLPSWPLLGRLTGHRVVCHVHEAEWPGPAVLHRLLLAPLQAAAEVVVNSGFTRDAVVAAVPALAGRTTVVLNAVPGPADPASPRPRLDGGVRLLYVGRLSPRKGPDVAVTALRELLDRGVDARLTLVGSVFTGYGWFAEQLRALVADLGVGDRVELVGFRSDVWPALADADVVLVPSVLDESFGNAAVEAVLAARPVVVSDLGGLREATAGLGTARVAAVGDPAAWADAVQALVADWPAVAAAVPADAAAVRARHAPALFRRRLGDLVVPAAAAAVPALPVPALPVPRRTTP